MGQVLSAVWNWLLGRRKGATNKDKAKAAAEIQEKSHEQDHQNSHCMDIGSINAPPVWIIGTAGNQQDKKPRSHLEEIKDVIVLDRTTQLVGSRDQCDLRNVEIVIERPVKLDHQHHDRSVKRKIKDVIVLDRTTQLAKSRDQCDVEIVIERPVKLDHQHQDRLVKRKGPYTSSQRILLVGEGDFSFSACLAVAFGSASNMVATSLDSWEFLTKNYKRAMGNVVSLRSRGCTVMHEVDATKMAMKCSTLRVVRFDRIVFNFPHAGVFKNDGPTAVQLCKHQRLISMFLANAKKLIKENGEIHITHKSNGFFLQWKITLLAKNQGLQLIEETPFHFREYDGYHTKFGYGGDGNFNCNPSTSYKFRLCSLSI